MALAPSRDPSASSLSSLVRAATWLLGSAALVAVGCVGSEDETYFDENEGGDGGVGESGGSKGGSQSGDSGDVSSGGSDGVSGAASGLAGSGGNVACNLADLESCAAGVLCCPGPAGGECVPSSMQNCGACHAMCNPTTTDACIDRACVCGTEPACTGDAPFCHEGHCAECRNDGDCAESPGGDQCVSGVCSECDPTDHSGCSDTTPCLSSGECAPCDPDTGAGCTAPTSVCDSDFLCKECVEDSDCSSGKVCSPDNACIDCTSDTDCANNPAGPECVGDTCRECDPVGNAGCSGQKDTCNSGTFVCVECMNGSQCAPGQGCSNFDCTECGSDGECAGNAGGAQCVQITPGNFECKPCDPLDDSGCAPPATCTAGFACVD